MRKIDYHKTDIHKRMLRSIALNVELLYNDKDWDISEYDVQAIMSRFLKNNLLNTDYKVDRERFGKFDCAISKKGYNRPVILYELKTFSKPKERLNVKSAYKKIEKDLIKLNNGKNGFENARAYMILVLKKEDISKKKLITELDFVEEHLNNNKKWIEKTANRNIKIKLRPSSKTLLARAYVLSWEIK